MDEVTEVADVRELKAGDDVVFVCPAEGCTSKQTRQWMEGGNARFAMPPCYLHVPPVVMKVYRAPGPVVARRELGFDIAPGTKLMGELMAARLIDMTERESVADLTHTNGSVKPRRPTKRKKS